MPDLTWNGDFEHEIMRDVGSIDDEGDFQKYDFYGRFNNQKWTADSATTKLLGTADSDIIFLDVNADQRLFDISYISTGSGDDLVDLTSEHFPYQNTTILGGAGNDWLLGNTGNDKISGDDGDDLLKGYGGKDTLSGGKGNDRLFGGQGTDVLDGGDDNDVLIGDSGADTLIGGSGSDTASYASATSGVSVYMTKMQKNKGDANGDTFKSIENLTGSDFADNLYADGSASTLKGGGGNDVLYGNNGADRLTGGTGADTFLYKEVSDSRTTSYDIVYDFSESDGDKFDLSGLDASTKVSGNNAFVFIGNNAFSGSAGQLRFQTSGNNTDIFADTNGDKKADFQIHLSAAQTLHAGDFIV